MKRSRIKSVNQSATRWSAITTEVIVPKFSKQNLHLSIEGRFTRPASTLITLCWTRISVRGIEEWSRTCRWLGLFSGRLHRFWRRYHRFNRFWYEPEMNGHGHEFFFESMAEADSDMSFCDAHFWYQPHFYIIPSDNIESNDNSGINLAREQPYPWYSTNISWKRWLKISVISGRAQVRWSFDPEKVFNMPSFIKTSSLNRILCQWK